MTSQRRSSYHSHTGNQVGCEHRICDQDGPVHSPPYLPDSGFDPAMTEAGALPDGACFFDFTDFLSGEGTDALCFSDFPFFHDNLNSRGGL